MPTRIDNLLVWGAEGIEPNTLAQAQEAAALPFVHSHLALMPDAHVGIGATIGSVIATRGAIIPSAVGVDIGCGMIAARTQFSASDLPDSLGPLHGLIREGVPAGVGQGHEHEENGLKWIINQNQFGCPIALETEKQMIRAARQLGTLGSGNHFVEVCLDESDRVWVMLHSGSRGIGNEIAKRHIEGAKGLMRRYFIELADPDLAYFVERTPEFDAYIMDMLWAQDYAKENREHMMRTVLAALGQAMGREVEVDEQVNCHHNYCEREHHHKQDLWVTRKGAIRARRGDLGIIPGSMATGSYIVTGLGNPVSFTSASHGAGRRMSRGEARKTVTEAELNQAMEGKTWNDRDAKTLLDEAPAAYKPIEAVMEAQRDLVEVTHTLRQVLNYKGT
jgi:tRNA-splicing ligase RtcB (3'-phosphate/5'-hydroxy nucleic acid ligase)